MFQRFKIVEYKSSQIFCILYIVLIWHLKFIKVFEELLAKGKKSSYRAIKFKACEENRISIESELCYHCILIVITNYQKGNENVQINSFSTLQEEHALLTVQYIVL